MRGDLGLDGLRHGIDEESDIPYEPKPKDFIVCGNYLADILTDPPVDYPLPEPVVIPPSENDDVIAKLRAAKVKGSFIKIDQVIEWLS